MASRPALKGMLCVQQCSLTNIIIVVGRHLIIMVILMLIFMLILMLTFTIIMVIWKRRHRGRLSQHYHHILEVTQTANTHAVTAINDVRNNFTIMNVKSCCLTIEGINECISTRTLESSQWKSEWVSEQAMQVMKQDKQPIWLFREYLVVIEWNLRWWWSSISAEFWYLIITQARALIIPRV